MAVQTVFSDNLDPAAPNLSSRFIDASAFYIDAPLIDSELEIDVYLQVYFPAAGAERVRNLPLGKISEQSILLNITDTESVTAIPSEFIGTGLEMALLFLASSNTFLEAYVIGKNCTVCQLKTEVDGIKSTLANLQQQLDRIEANSGNPVPVGTSAQQQQQLFFR